MKIFEFEIEIVAPEDLIPVPEREYSDLETEDILTVISNAAFYSMGEFLWGEEGVKGRTFISCRTGEKVGREELEGFTEEHKRSIIVDAHVTDICKREPFGFSSAWHDTGDQHLKFGIKLEIAARDNVIEYDLFQAFEEDSSPCKENMEIFIKEMRRRVHWASVPSKRLCAPTTGPMKRASTSTLPPASTNW